MSGANISPKYKKGDQLVHRDSKIEILDVTTDQHGKLVYVYETIASRYHSIGKRHSIEVEYLDRTNYTLYSGPRDTKQSDTKTRAADITQFKASCSHSYPLEKYNGFSQTYEFCKLCDTKFYPKN